MHTLADVKNAIENGDHKFFPEADLRGADLKGVRLARAMLTEADLGEADLWGSDLRGACLRYADVSDADLRGADLSDSDLRDADLSDSDLRGADMSDADLRGADLSGVIIDEHTRLEGSLFNDSTQWPPEWTYQTFARLQMLHVDDIPSWEREACGIDPHEDD